MTRRKHKDAFCVMKVFVSQTYGNTYGYTEKK